MLNNFIVTSSPLEQFETTNFISFTAPILGDFVISLTNVGLYSLIVLALGIGYHALAANTHPESEGVSIVPSKWSLSLESSYATLHSMVKEQIGSANEIYVPFIYSLFFFILLANLVGNVPYSFAFTSSAIVAMGLSVMIFLGVTILGFMRHGIHFFSFFVPAGTPLALVPLLALIELISYFARAFSLGVRLFANIVAGHTLLKILSGFLYPALTSGILLFFVTLLPMAIFIALVGLEIAVSLIQAYVFTILTCSYLKDAIELH
jgi:F-type H+-transporting ATPase subunit a